MVYSITIEKKTTKKAKAEGVLSMKVATNQELTYVEKLEKISKKGDPYSIVVLGNQVTFERFEFFVSDGIDYTRFSPGDKVKVVFDLTRSGYNNRIDIAGITHAVQK